MYRILIAIILMLPTFSHAINYLGFGGGSYVYAEQGNLYFNIDPYAFDNRSWTYDETKGFSAEIKVNMDLKTKYTSDEWLEQVLANKKSDGIMYANYIKQPFNYQNRGQYQHTWFWLARLAPTVGGFIGRTAAWGAFKRFAASNFGKVTNYVALPAFFAFLAADDITCESGDCTKTVSTNYIVTMSNGKVYYAKDQQDFQRQFYPELSRFINSYYNTNTTPANCTGGFSQNSIQSCGSYSPLSMSKITTLKVENRTFEEIVNDPELLPYFDKTCKLFSSECVNEPTQGKNIKDVQLTGGVVGSPINVIGPPYTNPITGTSHQDQVIIGGSSSGIGVNSATNDSWEYSPTLGQSGLLNPTQVTSIPRPDLTNTDTAPVAKPNEQTGTKPQVVVPPVTVPEFTDLNDMIDFCKANPKAMSCIETGTGEEAESIFDKIKIPEINLPTEFSKDNFLPATAACPAPTSIVTSHGTIMYSYDKHCEIAAFLRPIILIMATITGLFIIIRSKD